MTAQVPDELWQEFHTIVNMTSRELEDWLRTRSAGEDTEELPDQIEPPTGQQVVEILGKRRRDLTPRDARTMQHVIDSVHRQANLEAEPKAGDAEWRHQLMDLGHDPLKPTRPGE
ncbi:hypothetical protein AQ490_03970 [Wenjunlia vitaminophila]|uniref:DUF3140 domain-containing protein n=1 Tax=Wenjunlia vitaminophila TaxID=76728 RepID=A0A0T6LQW0_WENVI|nr:DUF3140 domain-containing protein [Wenjunlia vitaminophila]KRV48421.1 hypothetical protein AQ490_03970 [Wenjunlia vitaminophila]